MADFPVKVKFFGRSTGNELSVNVSPTMKISELKQALAPQAGDDVTPDRLKLIFLGRVLSDDNTVSQYGISENQVLHMVVKPADAAEQPPRPQPAPEPAPAGGAPGGAGGGGAGPGGIPFPAGMFGAAGMGGGGDGAEGGAGGVDMGGLFRGIFQNLNAVQPLMQATLARAQAATATGAGGGGGAAEAAAADRTPRGGAAVDDDGAAPAPTTTTVTEDAAPQAGDAHHDGDADGAAAVAQQDNQFHVHVHVTMDELEQLPARINAFNSRMASMNPGVNSQVHVQNRSGGAANMRGAAAAAARRPNPATSQPSTATLRDGPSLIAVVRSTLLDNPDIGEMMRLMQGDWAPLVRVRTPVEEAVRARARSSTPPYRALLVNESVDEIITGMRSNDEVRRVIQDHARPNTDVFAVVRGGLRIAVAALLDHVLDSSRDEASFTNGLRRITVRNVGHALSYLERKVARNGQASVDAILHAAVQGGTREALARRPEMAPLAGMAPMLVVPTLQGWREEYERAHRRPNDDARLEAAAAEAPAAPSTQAAPAPAAAAAADDAAADELLDEVLQEADKDRPAAARVAGNETGAPTLAALRDALGGAAMDPAIRARVLRAAEGLGSATVAPPPAHFAVSTTGGGTDDLM